MDWHSIDGLSFTDKKRELGHSSFCALFIFVYRCRNRWPDKKREVLSRFL